MNRYRALASAVAAAGSFIAPLDSASAELVLSQLVVELTPGTSSRVDVEVWNNDPDRSFVSVEPREIIAPGTAAESRRDDPDPEKLGLLVSPSRMILEPGQRKLLRIAALRGADHERVYRVTVKPVVGQLSAEKSGLKVLVGYDLLVLVRPAQAKVLVSGTRSGGTLTLHNGGNVSVELTEGKACAPQGKGCDELPGGRLYAGADKAVAVPTGLRVGYFAKVGAKTVALEF